MESIENALAKKNPTAIITSFEVREDSINIPSVLRVGQPQIKCEWMKLFCMCVMDFVELNDLWYFILDRSYCMSSKLASFWVFCSCENKIQHMWSKIHNHFVRSIDYIKQRMRTFYGECHKTILFFPSYIGVWRCHKLWQQMFKL